MIPAGRWWRGWRGRGGGAKTDSQNTAFPFDLLTFECRAGDNHFSSSFCLFSHKKKTKKKQAVVDAQWSSGVGHTEQSLCNQQQIWVIDSVNYFVIDSVKTIVN